MNEPLSTYASLGLVHHMLHARTLEDPAEHIRTLEEMLARRDIETIDCCLPYGDDARARLAAAVRASGKQHVTFATHLFPLRKLSFASTSYSEQAQARMIVADMVAQAASIGATGFIFASGGPRPREATPAHYRAFADFCRWLCAQLRPHGITALLEPFDMEADKCFLMGPVRRCAELMEELSADFDNIGLELDFAHLPLMGEEIAEAVEAAAPWLKRVHLGNCVMRDPADPFYGDKHPPIGYPGGEIDVPQVAQALQALLDVGYLNREKRGDVVIELNPFPGRSADESVADNLERVERAWRQVVPARAKAAAAVPLAAAGR